MPPMLVFKNSNYKREREKELDHLYYNLIINL
jgi:hypothetical protein